MDEENSRRGAQTWSEYESQRQQDEAALPDAVKAILEACRDRSNETSLSSEDREKLPYPCRIYEAVQGEEELLQLQWMRVDVSVAALTLGTPQGCCSDVCLSRCACSLFR